MVWLYYDPYKVVPWMQKINLIKTNLPAKMEAQIDMPHFLTQPTEGQNQFENKKQPELSENRSLWKLNN